MTKRLHKASKRRRQDYLKKMALLVLTLCIISGLSILFGGNLVDAHENNEESAVAHKYYKSIEIESGDTLWGIAKEYMNEEYDSIFEYIYEIKEMNNLDSDDIQEGQFLTVAYYDTEFK